MSVNRSGYYKWLARKDMPNRYEKDRIILTELLLEQHKKHKTKGYHYLARLVRNETGLRYTKFHFPSLQPCTSPKDAPCIRHIQPLL